MIENNPNTYYDYVIWRMTETEEELLTSLQHHEYFAEKVSKLKDGSRRKLEVLSVRRALKNLCYGEEQQVVYDADGKPSLKCPYIDPQGSVYSEIAISHTDGYAAVAISNAPIGIDIERRGNRVQRVVSHYLKPEEISLLLLTSDYDLALHMAWSAKEAAYKILGKAYFDLQKLTSVIHADLDPHHTRIVLKVEGRNEPLVVHFSLHKDYVFAWVIAPES